MTLVIGINLRSLIILAADTRTVWISDGKITSYTDDSVKIQDTGLGLMTGSGYIDLLDSVKNRVINTEISHTDQIYKIIAEERELVRKDNLIEPDVKRIILDQTGWMFSYLTHKNNKDILRLAVIHPSITLPDNDIALVRVNDAVMIPPNDLPEDKKLSLQNKLSSSIQPLDSLANLQENFAHNISLINAIIKEVSDVSETVSTSFYIGIHLLDNSREIIPMLNNQS